MSRYIDVEVLIDDLVHNRGFYPAMVASAIKNTPTADVVEVVRCKDCKSYKTDTDYCKEYRVGYCEWDNTVKTKMHFCSYGERREQYDQT